MGQGARLLMGVSATTVLSDWVQNTGVKWDVCATLHVPEAKRIAAQGWTADWLSDELRHYFNQLDRDIFKSAHRNHGARVYRFITLENSEGVGWHAHALLRTPVGMQQAAFISLADQLWQAQQARYAAAHFQLRLSVIEPLRGNFAYYMIKSVHDGSDNSKGVLDLQNIHLS
jgi:hypothetical protein